MAAEERPTLCGDVNYARLVNPHIRNIVLMFEQRESSALIKGPPVPYQQESPPKRQNILEFDCRGLEFTEYKPEVGDSIPPRDA